MTEISVGICQYTYQYMTEIFISMYQLTLVYLDPGRHLGLEVKGLRVNQYFFPAKL